MRPPFKVEIWKPVDDNPHLFAVTESFEAGEKPIRRLSLTFEWAKSSECGVPSEHCCFRQTRMTIDCREWNRTRNIRMLGVRDRNNKPVNKLIRHQD